MTLKEIIIETVNRMNSNELYTNVIYSFGKCGVIQKCLEHEIMQTLQKHYPKHNIYHPEDNSGLPDIYVDVNGNGHGIEIKTTKGWPKYSYRKSGKVKLSDDSNVHWSNGTIQTSTENFLYIKFTINGKLLVIDNAWFGRMSYKDWYVHKGRSLRISKNIINKTCRKLI